MAERSFAAEVEKLKIGDGEVFRGEGILAITKALLECGVGYVGGYQGAPISHLMDVLSDAQPILSALGVHFEASASEATATAMLAAQLNVPSPPHAPSATVPSASAARSSTSSRSAASSRSTTSASPISPPAG